jgi:CRP-like cAMP-binding protein
MSDEALEHEEAFPHLTRDLLAVLEAAGERRTLTKGDVLSRAGEVAREFCVVISGSLAGYEDHGSTTEHPIRVIGKGRFWGGTNLLTGQPAYLTTAVAAMSTSSYAGAIWPRPCRATSWIGSRRTRRSTSTSAPKSASCTGTNR